MTGQIVIHASTVAFRGRGLLILGPSGAGKSALALQLMALGCDLVSDDQTLLEARSGQIWASAPATIRGRIEARGLGILPAATVAEAALVAAADLSQTESARLPAQRTILLADLPLRAFHKIAEPHYAAALLQYLKGEDLPGPTGHE